MYTVKWMVADGTGDGYLTNNWNKYNTWFSRVLPYQNDKLFKNKALAQRAINRIVKLNWIEYYGDVFTIVEVKKEEEK